MVDRTGPDSFPDPLGTPGELSKLWACAGASGVVFVVTEKSSISLKTATVYDIEQFRQLVVRLTEVLDECESMKHLSRHPEWDRKENQ